MEKFVGWIVKYKAAIIAVVVALFVAMVASLGMLIYNSTIHIGSGKVSTESGIDMANYENVAGVYGMNGKRNTKITFDQTTVEAVLEAVDGMKYMGSEKGSSARYQTYVCIEMVDGTKYFIKYCDQSSVYISNGAARVGSYANTKNAEAMSNILKILTALENKNGANATSSSGSASSSPASSAAQSAVQSEASSASVNSVEQ